MRQALNQPVSFDATMLDDLEDFMLFTISIKDVIKDELARRLRNHINNAAMESTEKPNRD